MDSDVRGQKQTAYQLSVVREVDGSELWNTGKVESDRSIDIPYQGVALQAEKGYTVNLSVWDKDGKEYRETTRFETGIMNPRISAWNGADWVGLKQTKLDAASQVLYEIETGFTLKKGDVASLVLGADDFRLHNAFLNDFGTQSAENYIKVDFDFGKQEIRIFRVGYYKEDKADKGRMTSYKATVPANTTATVYLPVADSVKDGSVCEGAAFKGFTTRNGRRVACYEVVAGSYEFTIGNTVTVSFPG